MDALIQQKHKRAQSYSSVQANGNFRKQKLEMMSKFMNGIKRGKLPPIKSPKQLDFFVFGQDESSSQLIQNELQKSAMLEKLGLATDSSFNMMMTAKNTGPINFDDKESSIASERPSKTNPFAKFENTNQTHMTASQALLKDKLNSK